MIIANPNATTSAYPSDLKSLMSIERADESLVWLSYWDRLYPSATPLCSLPSMAEEMGVAQLDLKDESLRSPLGSFKALGAPIALIRLILRRWPEAGFSPRSLITGEYADQLRSYTVISATDGNHGRALAAAAQSIGCRCVIVLHANVSHERETAIAAYGARIVRIPGNYDQSVEEAARTAALNGWDVVADTSYNGYEEVPRDVMQGYGAIAAEIISQTSSDPRRTFPYTHVFLQGGVGGLAAGIVSYVWEALGPRRPKFVVVEPHQADCLFQSALKGHAEKATGSVDSIMAGLACGETSPIAWKFLRSGVDYFMTISDDDAVQAMRALAEGGLHDMPIVSGESGAAGLAGLMVLRSRSSKLEALDIGLNSASRVLVINTEGATAPLVYRDLVGMDAETVLRNQRAWSQK